MATNKPDKEIDEAEYYADERPVKKERYLSDPEQPKEPWFEPIEAPDDDSAEEKCLDLADEYGVELTDVRHQYENCYDCHFE